MRMKRLYILLFTSSLLLSDALEEAKRRTIDIEKKSKFSWEEVIPEHNSATITEGDECALSAPPGGRILKQDRPWFRTRTFMPTSNDHSTTPSSNDAAKLKPENIHPLRTNLWEIRLSSWRNKRLFPKRSFVMDFDHSANFCRQNGLQEGEEEAVVVGKWFIMPAGVRWRTRTTTDDEAKVNLHFTAELHLNPFGKHPRMLRGTVVRDRFPNSWLPQHCLRPVVATFEAVGIGQDYANKAYENRAEL